ncbi:hypothetical protein GUJ93_ZPchr0003g17704 [Zizania palustris]|uniref:Flavodoxin-like domain-containing protein n=1 Tax=Zizania palustris TaxID=103762 RepID=A0A8J5SHE3_ZIZPA|nr:hypothetical protein GUJ93_ZPchr0003g17704 [Zizania palustris]
MVFCKKSHLRTGPTWWLIEVATPAKLLWEQHFGGVHPPPPQPIRIPFPRPRPLPSPALPPSPTLLYASATGTSKTLATHLSRLLTEAGVTAHPTDAAAFDPDDLPSVPLLLLVLPTHDGGAPPPAAAFLARWLEESASDFRAGAALLSRVRFAVFGVGSLAYGETFNAAARSFTRWLRALGAVEVVSVGEGDVDGGDLEAVFEQWCGRVLRVVNGEEIEVVPKEDSDDFHELELEGKGSDDDEEEVDGGEVDMEDIAGKAPARKQNGKVERTLPNGGENGAREMVTPIIRTSLEKQGYKIIGSHSGVKICRWTKSQLRGRGGCYKHSFYGIESHRGPLREADRAPSTVEAQLRIESLYAITLVTLDKESHNEAPNFVVRFFYDFTDGDEADPTP